MRVRENFKDNSSTQANLPFKGYLENLNYQLLQSFLLRSSSILPMAIVLSSLPVSAAEKLPALNTFNKNTTLELNTPPHSDTSSKTHAIESSKQNSDGAAPNQQLDHAPVHLLILNQVMAGNF